MVGGLGGATVSQRADRILTLLSHSRRRIVLYVLRDSGKATVDDLVDAVLDHEDGTQPGTPDRERVAVSLLHKHLPRMADAGVVEHHAETGIVSAADGIEDLKPFLDALSGDDTFAESKLPLLGEHVVS